MSGGSEGGVSRRYEALAAAGTIEPDRAQRAVVARLDSLATALNGRRLARKSSPLGWLFGRRSEPLPKGLYLWGSVGRGKTMLMDLFFDSLDTGAKRRSHFHAYMADVHGRVHAWRQAAKAGAVKGEDPIRAVAADLAAEARVLCFDEFIVTDIADAMILGRLFTALFEAGVVVVATSNRVPDDLYKDGLNRALFLPFIALLKERLDVERLDSRTDYRLEKIGDTPVYFAPDDADATRRLDDLVRRLTGGAPMKPETLTVQGHPVEIPAAAMGVARVSFADLCRRPYGASDFLAIAQRFHTVAMDAIPRLHPDQRNEVRRFITLVDVLYERHVRLLASAAAEPDALYAAETGSEVFEFDRTISRLHEMRSREYLSTAARDEPSGNTTGLVDT